jgi:HPr kinase/phosphorylase
MNTHSHISNLHGTAVSIDNVGVIISGESGSGKTDLAIELISRGHQFIADDLVVVKKNLQNQLIITADAQNTNFAHLRGVGFINVDKCFAQNPSVVKAESTLDLIIQITNTDNVNLPSPVGSQQLTTQIMGIKVPTINLVTCKYRNLGLVAEIIVRNFILIQNGYNANAIFLEKFSQITE